MPNRSRRRFLVASGATAAASAMSARETDSKPVLRFGLMADCQYADIPAQGKRFYRESPPKLREAITEFNKHDLAFTLHLGDLIDRDFASFDAILSIAGTLQSKLHHLLGNHDFDVADDLKGEVPKKLGLTDTYYRLRHSGTRFIVLDTTEVSTYRHSADSPETHQAKVELKRLRDSGFPGAKPWNSGIGDQQLAWLEKELVDAGQAAEPVLVFGHHPIAPLEGHALWNQDAVLALLGKHHCVKAYINGHNHAGAYVDEDGLHCLTLDGMLDTKDQNAFAHAALHDNRLEITGFGRQESHVLNLR